jgi:hypothetical protein
LVDSKSVFFFFLVLIEIKFILTKEERKTKIKELRKKNKKKLSKSAYFAVVELDVNIDQTFINDSLISDGPKTKVKAKTNADNAKTQNTFIPTLTIL